MSEHRMTVRNEYPPNFDAIDKAFCVKQRRGIVYAFGDTIFAPDLPAHRIPPEIIAHETVHGERQSAFPDPRLWWERYIEEKAFRLAEEVYAHAAEYEHLAQAAHSRPERRFYLQRTAKKLAAPLYGRLVTEEKAKFLIARVAN